MPEYVLSLSYGKDSLACLGAIKHLAEIERLQKENNQFAYIGKLYSEIKSEAIKELLDKIEKQAIPNEDDVYWVELDDIYNLVKKMAGEG